MYVKLNLLFIGNLGGWEFFLILVVVLLLFGAKKLPELARGLGSGIREFKDASKQLSDEIQNTDKEPKQPMHSKPNTPPITTDQKI